MKIVFLLQRMKLVFFFILQLLLSSAFTYVIGIAVALFQRIKNTKLILKKASPTI